VEIIVIEAQGEAARFVPAIGCGCLGYRVGTLEVIWSAADIEALTAKPHSSGIPILFPWPGRIAGARFSWRGKDHQLPMSEPARGNAIHGLVCDRPFRVSRRGPYYFAAELDAASDPVLKVVWPYLFRLALDYEVGNGLRLTATVTNTGDQPMPFGFGTHPYFRTPLDPTSSRAAMRIRLESSRRRILDERLIPTGQDEPVSGKYDLRSGLELNGESYDEAFRAPAPDADGMFCGRLIDPELKAAVEVRADSSFGEWVVYAPIDRPIVSIEPYTCASDAFNLAARGIDAGARELAPGASWRGTIEIRITSDRRPA
jgi:aldose 1-epimerase